VPYYLYLQLLTLHYPLLTEKCVVLLYVHFCQQLLNSQHVCVGDRTALASILTAEAARFLVPTYVLKS
jgi:hypothetical protein